jgi:hypothetical protein
MKRKIQCDRVLKCEKCNKEFKQIGHLQSHQNRKTVCEPIQGDPKNKVEPDVCIYCQKVFKSKYNMKAHLGICKFKDGGIALMRKKMELLEKENKAIKESIYKDNGGYVYFINIENTTKFKIGYTKQYPEKRMSTLQTGCPDKLVMFKIIVCDDPLKLEQYLHECFAENNIRGEWYDMEHNDVEKIADFLKRAS